MKPLFSLILFSILTSMGTGQVIQGECSYYNDKYNGNPTASGEPYDKTKFTAASSRGHAFGTMLKVTNLKNGLSVNVKVNDKMGNKKRVLDLSRAAAEKIDMVKDGVAQLKIEPAEASTPPAAAATPQSTPALTVAPAVTTAATAPQQVASTTGQYRLQYGSYNEGIKAAAHSKSLHAQGIMNEIVLKSGAHKILGLRKFSSKDLASKQIELDFQSTGEKAFIVTY